MSEIFRPSHAYVPGATPRHPEAAFDGLKSGITSGMTEAEIQSSLAWRAGNIYRAEGYYWECHEVLEAVWLASPDGPLRSYVQAIIQMANAQLKEKMGRPKAAVRLCDIVCGHLDACAGVDTILGEPVAALRAEAKNLSCRYRRSH